MRQSYDLKGCKTGWAWLTVQKCEENASPAESLLVYAESLLVQIAYLLYMKGGQGDVVPASSL